MSVDRQYGLLAAALTVGAGITLAFILAELGTRQLIKQYRTHAREKLFEHIREFDDQLKQLEKKMWLKLKKTKEEAEKMNLVVD